jgi:phenylpropionate dioxygenase-like ring-hydroxylating dioxygenase large terminal subunit
MQATENGTRADAAAPQKGTDLRALIPQLGLREYWYPAIRDRQVGWGKPVFLKMLGESLCLFRGQSGQVAALADACPHRGAMLSHGDCMFRGFVTCFYHGYTWDERGECVAVLGEGPLSPMSGKVHARVYPTVTLKGVVFVWMGAGEPAPLAESIPEEFFDPDAMVFNWANTWACNWRPALENVADSHFRYLHRNSIRLLMNPIPPPSISERGRVGRPVVINSHRLRPIGQDDPPPEPTRGGPRRGPKRPYQDYYPGVDAKWPLHRWRLLWTWFFGLLERPMNRRPYPLSEEWGRGQHLPSMFRQPHSPNVYTRWVTPVDESHSRVWYFLGAKPSGWLRRLVEHLHWHLFYKTVVTRNFSEQDARGAIEAYPDTRENLSISDIQTTAWRKFIITARGMEAVRSRLGESSTAIEAAPVEPMSQRA